MSFWDRQTLVAEILEWSGSWATSMSSRSKDSFANELENYPVEDVRKALKKARAEWENMSHPTLKFVLDRIPRADPGTRVISGFDFGSSLELWGPAWDDPACAEGNRVTLETWAKNLANFGDWKTLSHHSVAKAFERYGAQLPVKPDPRQSNFGDVLEVVG